MFGLGPAEILLIATVIVLLLIAFVIVVLIIYAGTRLLSGKRESKLEARVAELERKLDDQQKKRISLPQKVYYYGRRLIVY